MGAFVSGHFQGICDMSTARALAITAALCLPAPAFAADAVELELLGTYKTGIFDESAAEIVAYEPEGKRLYVVNADAKLVDILDLADPAGPVKAGTLDAKAHGKKANSVAVHGGLIAVAVAADPDQKPGKVVFFTSAGEEVGAVEVGAGPDMVTFTPDGAYVLTANEGEPSDDYKTDPEGSVSIIKVADKSVRTAGFGAFSRDKLPEGMRMGHPTASFAEDVEPEYIAVSPDSRTAYVTLQENNAIAVVDIASAKVTKVFGLGYQDHSKIAFDPSNKDGGARLGTWPVWGMYMPDAIAAYEAGGKTYLVTANEGDSREYEGFEDEARIKDVTLDPAAFPNADELQAKTNLGRLKISPLSSDADGDGKIEKLMAFGSRSFSIWNEAGNQVFDSRSDFEKITADRLGVNFNSTNDENGSGDDRSDDKGPEPEGVTVGTIGGKTYAFIGLERVGGIMVYDVTEPAAARFAGYANNRDFAGDPKTGTAGDLGPEGLAFIGADISPNGKPLLAVGNEVSGTTSIYEVVVK